LDKIKKAAEEWGYIASLVVIVSVVVIYKYGSKSLLWLGASVWLMVSFAMSMIYGMLVVKRDLNNKGKMLLLISLASLAFSLVVILM